MPRFVALSWHPADLAAQAESDRYRVRLTELGFGGRAVDAPGFMICHDWPSVGPLRSWTLPGNRGVILGRFFGSSFSLDEERAQRIVSSGGSSLETRYWGSFVALLFDPPSGMRVALRSVGAGLSCYWLRRSTVDVFFSDLADVAALDIEPLHVNWRYLAAFVAESTMTSRESGFRNVTEILAGERVTIVSTATSVSKGQEVLWSPVEHCIEDEGAVPEELRATTQSCIDAWASVHRNVVLQLSGGFDSSVVLGCLRRVPVRPKVTCVNRFGDEAGEDERVFARAAARRAGVPLDERRLRAQEIRWTERLNTMPVSPKPSIPALLQVETESLRDCAARARAQACWSGQGGDHLFFQFRTEWIVADFVRRHGLGAGLPQIIRDTARLTRRPYAAFAALALRTRFGRSCAPCDCLLLPAHPWIEAAETLPPAKGLQVKGLLELLNRHGVWTRAPPYWEVHPLISRPLIEWCLRLPSWVALRGGRSRSFARDAFASYLPRVIRERDTKGRTTWFLMQLVRRDARTIGDMLLDGMMAKQGLLDRVAIDRRLRHGRPLRKTELQPLLAALATEVWLRATAAMT